jgi:hypothetical protein
VNYTEPKDPPMTTDPQHSEEQSGERALLARGEPRPTLPRRALDAVQYAVALTALVAVLSSGVSLALGGGAVGLKYGLFLLGTAHLGYGTVVAWVGSRADALSNNGFLSRLGADDVLPGSGGSTGGGDGTSGRDTAGGSSRRTGSLGGSSGSDSGGVSSLAEPSPLQRAVRRLPPAAWYPVRARDRVGDAGRLFLASGTMFLLSFLLETVFGVAAV